MRRTSSLAMASSAGEKGGVFDSLRSRSSLATTLDLAGGHVGVAEAFAALADLALYGDDVLGARGFGLGVGRGAGFLVEDDLGDAGAVAHVEEDEVAVVAAAVDPAHEDYVLASLFHAQIAAHVRAL